MVLSGKFGVCCNSRSGATSDFISFSLGAHQIFIVFWKPLFSESHSSIIDHSRFFAELFSASYRSKGNQFRLAGRSDFAHWRVVSGGSLDRSSGESGRLSRANRFHLTDTNIVSRQHLGRADFTRASACLRRGYRSDLRPSQQNLYGSRYHCETRHWRREERPTRFWCRASLGVADALPQRKCRYWNHHFKYGS